MTIFYNKCCDDKYISLKMFDKKFVKKWRNLYDLNDKPCIGCPKLFSWKKNNGYTSLIHICIDINENNKININSKNLMCKYARKQLKEFENIRKCIIQLRKNKNYNYT